MRDPPDLDPLRALHDRLLAGDRLASEELLRRLLTPLVEEICRRFRRTDEQIVSDGVIDALLDYCAQPQQFDASSSVSLDRFLSSASWRNVHNLITSETKRRKREKAVGSKKREANVALDPVARNIRQEELQEFETRKAAMLAALDDPRDKEILALRFQGERDNAVFARVLGITDLAPEQQRAEVKRHKDRIARFLRRKGFHL